MTLGCFMAAIAVGLEVVLHFSQKKSGTTAFSDNNTYQKALRLLSRMANESPNVRERRITLRLRESVIPSIL